MPYHSKAKVQKLLQALQGRFDQLVVAVSGTEASDEELRMHGFTSPHVLVKSDDVRIAVDDFQTILKEIKASLGKR